MAITFFLVFLTLLFTAIPCASQQPDQNARMPREGKRSARRMMRDDGIIPNEFLMRISSACGDVCRSEVQELLDTRNFTMGCRIGSAGISIGSLHLESFSCDIEDLHQQPEYLLRAFAKELVSTVSRALAKGGTRPMLIENNLVVTIPISTPIPQPEEPLAVDSGCIFNSSNGVPFRGGVLFPHPRRASPPPMCDLFGIDETDGGFPRDGLRTCAPLSMNGRGTSVWILDTGCVPSPGGFCLDFLSPGAAPECDDTVPHGIGVSEIATGPSGVAVDSTRHCLRVLSDASVVTGWIPVLQGLEFVTQNLNVSPKGNVINLSLEGGSAAGGLATAILAALNEVTSLGAFVVGAAGNDGNDGVNACATLPASFRDERFFSVQAHDSEGVPFDGNNLSEMEADCVDISAPGVGIFTSLGDLDGTSFATPHVSGAIAVLLSDEREVSASTLTAVSRPIVNGPGIPDEPSLGLSCPGEMGSRTST